jgi:hypothetical protein
METFDIEQLRLPANYWEIEKQKQKQKQDIFAPDYKTEETASALIKLFLKRQGWDYEEEFNTGDGRIDFFVSAYDGQLDREIKFGIECKRQMSIHFNNALNATVLADYLEQAAAYSRALNSPVFIGPVQTNRSPSSAYIGGNNVDSVCALNIFGGRFNVGTLNFSTNPYYPEYLILRGASFWESGKGFNKKRLNIVTTSNSNKTRTAI